MVEWGIDRTTKGIAMIELYRFLRNEGYEHDVAYALCVALREHCPQPRLFY